MSESKNTGAFPDHKREVLHILAEMFSEKKDRDALRKILSEGATMSQLVQAYRAQKYFVTMMKTVSGLIVIVSAAYLILKGYLPK